MKRKIDRSGKVQLSKDELHDLRAVFAPFCQTKEFRFITKAGCNAEGNLTKGVITVTHESKVILRIKGLQNKHMVRFEQGITVEISAGG